MLGYAAKGRKVRIHELAFLEATPPYGAVGGGKATVIGDGAAVGWVREPIGAPGRAVLRDGYDYVAVLAVRRSEAGAAATANMKFILENLDTGARVTLLDVAAADILDDWRYFALHFVAEASIRGQCEFVWESASSTAIDFDQASLVRGVQIPDFESSTEEWINGNFGDDESAPPPLDWESGDWEDGVYKIAETA